MLGVPAPSTPRRGHRRQPDAAKAGAPAPSGPPRRPGRKPNGVRAGVPHLPREPFRSSHPLHVTLKAVPGLPSLRSRRAFRVVRDSLAATRAELGVRVVHFSVQSNHVHLVVEARNRASLGNGFRGIGIRLAKRLNFALKRSGAVLVDRFHSRVLRTPIAVRRVLAYVLGNARRHAAQGGKVLARGWVDPCSSAPWFDGFTRSHCEAAQGPSPALAAKTWLLRSGWRLHGLLDPDHVPGARDSIPLVEPLTDP